MTGTPTEPPRHTPEGLQPPASGPVASWPTTPGQSGAGNTGTPSAGQEQPRWGQPGYGGSQQGASGQAAPQTGQQPQAPYSQPQPQYGQPPMMPPPQYGHQPQPGQPAPQPGQQPQAPYGQPQYGQYGYQAGPGPQQGVWAQPNYGAGAPTWYSQYGQQGPQMKAATSGVRTLAYILDTVFIFIAMVVFVFFLVALTDAAGARKTAGGIAALLVMFVGLLLPYCYFGYLDGVRGGSWGKQIFGLRVIHAATGQPIGFWKAVLRLLVLVLTNWIFCACALSILFDSSGRKRGWHDQAAEACVVQN